VFLKTSRYDKVEQTEFKGRDGRQHKAVKIRRLGSPQGKKTTIKDNDRLDIIAQRAYNIPTRFWHIADANTELEANDLVSEVGRTIEVPEQ
jgi:hypothetical protein